MGEWSSTTTKTLHQWIGTLHRQYSRSHPKVMTIEDLSSRKVPWQKTVTTIKRFLKDFFGIFFRRSFLKRNLSQTYFVPDYLKGRVRHLLLGRIEVSRRRRSETKGTSSTVASLLGSLARVGQSGRGVREGRPRSGVGLLVEGTPGTVYQTESTRCRWGREVRAVSIVTST